jgi:hypothetical protein
MWGGTEVRSQTAGRDLTEGVGFELDVMNFCYRAEKGLTELRIAQDGFEVEFFQSVAIWNGKERGDVWRIQVYGGQRRRLLMSAALGRIRSSNRLDVTMWRIARTAASALRRTRRSLPPLLGTAARRRGGGDLDLGSFGFTRSTGRSRMVVFLQERGRDVAVRASGPLVVSRDWQQAIDGVYRHGFWGLAVLGGGVIAISLAFPGDLAEGGGIVSDIVHIVVHCEGRWEKGERGQRPANARGQVVMKHFTGPNGCGRIQTTMNPSSANPTRHHTSSAIVALVPCSGYA